MREGEAGGEGKGKTRTITPNTQRGSETPCIDARLCSLFFCSPPQCLAPSVLLKTMNVVNLYLLCYLGPLAV
jgi:hypothetical protein